MPLQGAKELKADFKAIGVNVRRSLSKAALAGARVVRDEARAAARSFSRFGVKGIVAVSSRGTADIGLAKVGFTPIAFHLRIRETGAQPHEITASLTTTIKDPKTKATTGTRTKKRPVLAVRPFPHSPLVLFRRRVQHPGQRAQPFLGPAKDRAESRAVEVMGQVFNAAIEQRLRGGGHVV